MEQKTSNPEPRVITHETDKDRHIAGGWSLPEDRNVDERLMARQVEFVQLAIRVLINIAITISASAISRTGHSDLRLPHNAGS